MGLLSWLGNPAATDRQALRSVTSPATRPITPPCLLSISPQTKLEAPCPSLVPLSWLLSFTSSSPGLQPASLSSSLTQREHKQSSLHLLSGLMPPGTAAVLGLQGCFTGISHPQGPQHSAAGWEWDATGAAWWAAVNNLLPSAFT